jgi:deoxycytidine triphosphate deaminase
VYNSPKSTSARTFKNVRVFFEGRSRFDIVDNMRDDDVIVRPWILLDPNHSAYEIQKDSSLTQLRIGNGLDSKLTAREILDAHTGSISTNGYGIFNLFSNGKLVPLDNLERYIDQNNNVSLRLNLHSRDGVVKQEKIGIEQGVGYLVESVEYVCVPPNISLEMIQSTSGGLRVTTHKGGYFDPGFKGTVVGEVELADEQTNRCLHHKEQVFAFALQRHREPTTMPYGVGSNYQEQVGVQYAKYFAAKIDPKSVIGWQTRLGVDAVIGSVNGAQDVLDFFKPIR